MSSLERRVVDCKRSSPLLAYARDTTSQGGEDGIIEVLCNYIGIDYKYHDNDDKKRPLCVDIGAWDGIHLSNSYSLVHENKWRGLLVEADPVRHKALKSLYSNRNPDDDVVCLCELVGFEGKQSLRNLIAKSFPQDENVEFVSIDVDGADYHLFDCLFDDNASDGIDSPIVDNNNCANNNVTNNTERTFQCRPTIICVEFNPSIPNDIIFIQDRSMESQQGSSLLALTQLAIKHNYFLAVTTTFNAFFIENSHRQQFSQALHECHFINDFNDVDAIVFLLNQLHSSSMITSMFQTYNGEIKVVGPKKLIWSKVPINPQQWQVISKKTDRKFPFAPPSTGEVSTDGEHNVENRFSPDPIDANLLNQRFQNVFDIVVDFYEFIDSKVDLIDSLWSQRRERTAENIETPPDVCCQEFIDLSNQINLVINAINDPKFVDSCRRHLRVSHMQFLAVELLQNLQCLFESSPWEVWVTLDASHDNRTASQATISSDTNEVKFTEKDCESRNNFYYLDLPMQCWRQVKLRKICESKMGNYYDSNGMNCTGSSDIRFVDIINIHIASLLYSSLTNSCKFGANDPRIVSHQGGQAGYIYDRLYMRVVGLLSSPWIVRLSRQLTISLDPNHCTIDALVHEISKSTQNSTALVASWSTILFSDTLMKLCELRAMAVDSAFLEDALNMLMNNAVIMEYTFGTSFRCSSSENSMFASETSSFETHSVLKFCQMSLENSFQRLQVKSDKCMINQIAEYNARFREKHDRVVNFVKRGIQARKKSWNESQCSK